MSTDKSSSKKSKIPATEIVIALVSCYFFYQAYSQISAEGYFAGGFFLVVGIVLLANTYITYKAKKGKE